jgi:autotransporter-associated beta strand protein
LVWDKTGTLTLSGTSTYTGSTTIDLGTLFVLGAIQSTNNLIFNNNGLLNLGSSGAIKVLSSNYSILDAEDDILAGRISGDVALQVSSYNDGFNEYTSITVIPETKAALLGGLGVLLLLRRRR